MLALEPILDRQPAALSGAAERAAMGRAIVRNPQAYLMDEPLSNLDAKLRMTMRGSWRRCTSGWGSPRFM
jgi:multiple sugar transport system ATP-binding protein